MAVPTKLQGGGCAPEAPMKCTMWQVPGPHPSSPSVLSSQAGLSAPACAVSTGAGWTVPFLLELHPPAAVVPLFLGVFCPQSFALCHSLEAALVNSPVILVAKCNR